MVKIVAIVAFLCVRRLPGGAHCDRRSLPGHEVSCRTLWTQPRTYQRRRRKILRQNHPLGAGGDCEPGDRRVDGQIIVKSCVINYGRIISDSAAVGQ